MIQFSKAFLRMKGSSFTSTPTFHFSFLTPSPHMNHDLIFIRHAESSFNKACEEYRLKNKIPYIWEQLCRHKGFDQTVFFNANFIDCPLSSKGIQQSKNAKSTLHDQPVDCVLVSPHLRALQTCENIFENRNVPKIVEPMLIGPLRSCSDVNRSTEFKKRKFPLYDFSALEKKDDLWFLNHLPPEQKQYCLRHFEKNKVYDAEQRRVELVKLLKAKKIFEDAKMYRKRIRQVKKMIERHKAKHEIIAVVTHYYTIQYLHANEYQEDGSPAFQMEIKNCKPYYCSSDSLMN